MPTNKGNERSRTKAKLDSRHGVHRAELVQMTLFVMPRIRAIAQVTANELRTTFKDLAIDGIMTNATKAGVIANGRVTGKYKPIVDAYIDVIKTKKRERSAVYEN